MSSPLPSNHPDNPPGNTGNIPPANSANNPGSSNGSGPPPVPPSDGASSDPPSVPSSNGPSDIANIPNPPANTITVVPDATNTPALPTSTNSTDQPWFTYACADASADKTLAHDLKMGPAITGMNAARAVIAKASQLWPNGSTLDYCFLSPFTGTDVQQNKVKTVITEWETYANVKFNYVESQNATIRISFNSRIGSWSYVGQDVYGIALSEPTMNLGWVGANTLAISDSDRGVILHEFGHALGLLHEHQSPARGGTITLKEDAVIAFYTASQHWSVAEVRQQILNVYNSSNVSNYSELDLKSIMMYFLPAEMDIEGIDVPPNNKLSDLDKAYILINYPHPIPITVDPVWTFEHALEVAGVDDTTRVQLIQDYQAALWDDLRYHFSQWSSQRRVVDFVNHAPTPPSKQADPSPVTEEEILLNWCASEVLTSQPFGASSAVASLDKDLWRPGFMITYHFQSGVDDRNLYRQRRVRETFDYYARFANLKFRQVSETSYAHIRIFVGPSPSPTFTSYSEIGQGSTNSKHDQYFIDTYGGDTETTMLYSDKIFPLQEPMLSDTRLRRLEERSLFHEIGHALGLRHEHASPFTSTVDEVDPAFSAATIFDARSVMLYANRRLQSSTAWEKFRDFFNPRSTKFNSRPSSLDLAFLGAIYPRGPGAIDDYFEKDLTTLGIGKAINSLKAQRDRAFTFEKFDEVKFDEEIRILRFMIRVELGSVAQGSRPSNGASKPSNGINNPARGVDSSTGPARTLVPPSLPDPTTGSFIDKLTDYLKSIFAPTGGQIFSLQFPGRYLQQEQYAWDTSTAGIYGQFVKPTVVNESEFRFVDQMYDVGTVVSGPNGINLSIVYDQCLNNLVPSFQSSTFTQQQDQIRRWLMKEVPISGWVEDIIKSQHTPAIASTPAPATIQAGAKASALQPMFAVSNRLTDTNTVNRMELAEALTQEYLTAKGAWETERDELIRNDKGDNLENVTRTLAHLTSIREAQLASKYADAVVRGYSHTIRQYLGYMDIKTAAEFLQDAKDSLREAAVSSLDGSLKVYPVQMQPIDWFQSLSTSFTLEDLTFDVDLMEQQIDQKSRQLDVLNSRLAAIQLKPKTDMKELQDQLDVAQTEYDQAQADLTLAYTDNVISLAKTCINSSGDFDLADFTSLANSFKIDESLWKDISAGMKKVTDAQVSVTNASRAFSRLLSAKALAQATDTEQEKTQINLEITAITKDLTELTARCQALRSKRTADALNNLTPQALGSIADVPNLPPVTGSSGGSRWQEIVMRHSVVSNYSAESTSSRSRTSKSNCNLFFASFNSESSSASASSASISGATTNTVQVGFRATLVTVDRGGWFQPQFFKESSAFYHNNGKITWSKFSDDYPSIEKIKEAGDPAFEFLNKSLLPAFPVGYIICKDITIKIENSSTNVASDNQNMERMLASAGGVLCWSTSSAQHEASSDKSYSFTALADGCIIRIPGPQVLGYIQQLTEQDETTPLPAQLPPGFLVADDDYDATISSNTLRPASAANPTSPNPPTNGVSKPVGA